MDDKSIARFVAALMFLVASGYIYIIKTYVVIPYDIDTLSIYGVVLIFPSIILSFIAGYILISKG